MSNEAKGCESKAIKVKSIEVIKNLAYELKDQG